MPNFNDEYTHEVKCCKCGKKILVSRQWTYRTGRNSYFCSWHCYHTVVYPEGVTKISEYRIRKYHYKPVTMLQMDGAYVRTFASVKDAADYLNCHVSSVSAACRGKAASCCGYILKFAEEEGKDK